MFRFQECWSSPVSIEKFTINLSKASRRGRGKCSSQTGLEAKWGILFLFVIVITVEKGSTRPGCDLDCTCVQ